MSESLGLRGPGWQKEARNKDRSTDSPWPSPQPGTRDPAGDAGAWSWPPTGQGFSTGWARPKGFTPLSQPLTGYSSQPTDAFDRPLAHWGQRVRADVLDTVFVSVAAVVLVLVFASAKAAAAGVLLAVVGSLAYFAVLDGSSQTLGKRMVEIAVRDERSGQPIGAGKALGRRLIYVTLWYLLFIPGLINALSPLWDERRQAWHDRAVGSVVVELRGRRWPSTDKRRDRGS